ncbi:MAG: ABC transporter ATP-binding protein [Reinekea sp.]|nr:ABC transporter ATP-binding protein [Reinekea sp.]
MIHVDQLYYRYPGQHQDTLKGLSFQVAPGEVFGFLGPSGSGKSTTQKLLIGLLHGHRGNAQLFNKDIAQWGAEIYRRIGVGFELPNHYSKLTALENMHLFASLYGLSKSQATPRIQQLLADTGLSDQAHLRTEEFSKGMKMRLNFARALLPNPDLLFLDEPTSGLDPVNASNIRNMIRQHKEQGKTIFLTTHNMYDADELCDRVAFMVDGELKKIDAPRQMKKQFGESTVTLEQRNDAGQLISADFPLQQLADNPAFLQQLARYPVETLHSKEASLEDVFIKVTGAQLT